MRLALFLLSVTAIPIFAAGAAAQSSPSVTPPSNMGRWDEYREREERREENENRRDLDRASRTRPANYSSVERRAAVSEYSKCIVAKETELVREAVLDFAITQPDRIFSRNKKLSDFECVPKWLQRDLSVMRLSGFGTRFAFSEVLWHTEFADKPVDFADIPPLDHPQILSLADRPKDSKWSTPQFAEIVEDFAKLRLLSRLGECVSRAEPVASRSLLLTAVSSDSEDGAIKILVPVVSRCLSGGSLKLLPEQLRGAVAFNHYRLQVARKAAEGQKPDA